MLRLFRVTPALSTWLLTPLLLAGCFMGEPVEVFSEPDRNPPTTNNSSPTISGSPPQMVKVGVNYSFTPTASDPDSDPISFNIANKPGWMNFDSATGNLSGVAVLGSEGGYDDIIISVSDGTMSTSLPPFSITVESATAGNLPPEIDGIPAARVTVGNAYSFIPSASDPDGNPLTFTVQNLPAWATFNSGNGQLSGIPQPGDEGTYANISVSVSDGTVSSSTPAFSIRVDARNSVPVISGTPASGATVGALYSFTPTASDADGDTLTFSIKKRPGWATFDAASGQLSGVPQSADAGDHNAIAISVSDGQVSASLPVFSIAVVANNSAPTISGTPPARVTVGAAYSFAPSASDPDGDTLTFSIQNRPGWATFDAASGRLSGVPRSADAGDHNGIAISVSDGQVSASLPVFSIAVVAAANSAPQISGTPASQVSVDQAYAFTPGASDPDGDPLTFSVQNLPSWASFDAAAGTLSGTPRAGDEGVYSNIVISVSDGTLTSSLAAFSITVNQVSLGSVTLSWTPPTLNTDGSPLTDLAGYVFRYGLASGSYGNTVTVNNAGISMFTIDNLAPNTYYFVVTALNSQDVESTFSNEASKTIN